MRLEFPSLWSLTHTHTHTHTVWVQVQFTYPDTYPDVPPEMEVVDSGGLSQEHVGTIERLLTEEVSTTSNDLPRAWCYLACGVYLSI